MIASWSLSFRVILIILLVAVWSAIVIPAGANLTKQTFGRIAHRHHGSLLSIIKQQRQRQRRLRNKHYYYAVINSIRRGGSSAPVADDTDEEKEETKRKKALEKQQLRKYRTEQHVLMQLRSTFLSEALASRGVPITTMMDVSTAEGDKPPEIVDWDCSLSTVEEPKTCLYSFDAEPNTKVVAPIGTTQWISLSALNRLRRMDPSKVEPMWHSRYAVLKSWFGDESEFSMLQHVGFRGFVISAVLLDWGKGMVLRSVLILSLMGLLIVCMPLLEYMMNRLLVSGLFWRYWRSWSRIVHAALPLKLLIGQLAWKFVAGTFNRLESKVREYVVDMECAILEESVPLTVGPGVDEEGEEDPMDHDEEDTLGGDEELGEMMNDEVGDYDDEDVLSDEGGIGYDVEDDSDY